MKNKSITDKGGTDASKRANRLASQHNISYLPHALFPTLKNISLTQRPSQEWTLLYFLKIVLLFQILKQK